MSLLARFAGDSRISSIRVMENAPGYQADDLRRTKEIEYRSPTKKYSGTECQKTAENGYVYILLSGIMKYRGYAAGAKVC